MRQHVPQTLRAAPHVRSSPSNARSEAGQRHDRGVSRSAIAGQGVGGRVFGAFTSTGAAMAST